jgi:hypothetical protein
MIMSELNKSLPNQADELVDTLYETLTGKRGTQKRDYFEYFHPLVTIPEELKQFLPPDPVRVGATVKMRTDTTNDSPEAALKLSWEYNPIESARRAGDPDWVNASRYRGTTFNIWHAHRNPSYIHRVSGMYEQPPMAAVDLGDISRERLLELADEQRLMADTAEMQAWQRVEQGIADPYITFSEADLLISFARHL